MAAINRRVFPLNRLIKGTLFTVRNSISSLLGFILWALHMILNSQLVTFLKVQKVSTMMFKSLSFNCITFSKFSLEKYNQYYLIPGFDALQLYCFTDECCKVKQKLWENLFRPR